MLQQLTQKGQVKHKTIGQQLFVQADFQTIRLNSSISGGLVGEGFGERVRFVATCVSLGVDSRLLRMCSNETLAEIKFNRLF